MNASIYQSPEWEEFKLKTGYSKSYRIDDILVLQRIIAVGRTMLYSPQVTEKNYELSIKNSGFSEQIRKIGRENNAIFYRLELDIPVIHNSKFLIPERFIKAFEEMQPENNWLVDLTPSEDQILAQMKQKGRYNIKIAQKNNLSFEFLDKKDLHVFYDQYALTGQRHKVTYRTKKYFEELLDILGQKGYARMCATFGTVNEKNTALSSAILLCYEDTVEYLFGASSEEHKNLMAPYLMHWEVMKWAKENGFKKYNFLGIAPDENEKHPWAGITRFKKQFGGYQYDILGCYDLVFKPIEYKIFKFAEKIRRH